MAMLLLSFVEVVLLAITLDWLPLSLAINTLEALWFWSLVPLILSFSISQIVFIIQLLVLFHTSNQRALFLRIAWITLIKYSKVLLFRIKLLIHFRRIKLRKMMKFLIMTMMEFTMNKKKTMLILMMMNKTIMKLKLSQR